MKSIRSPLIQISSREDEPSPRAGRYDDALGREVGKPARTPVLPLFIVQQHHRTTGRFWCSSFEREESKRRRSSIPAPTISFLNRLRKVLCSLGSPGI